MRSRSETECPYGFENLNCPPRRAGQGGWIGLARLAESSANPTCARWAHGGRGCCANRRGTHAVVPKDRSTQPRETVTPSPLGGRSAFALVSARLRLRNLDPRRSQPRHHAARGSRRRPRAPRVRRGGARGVPSRSHGALRVPGPNPRARSREKSPRSLRFFFAPARERILTPDPTPVARLSVLSARSSSPAMSTRACSTPPPRPTPRYARFPPVSVFSYPREANATTDETNARVSRHAFVHGFSFTKKKKRE